MTLKLLKSLLAVVALSYAPLLAVEGDLLDVRDAQGAPVKLIFDTDIGGDIDDAFALGLIHALANRGECELLAVTTTTPLPSAASYVAAFNRHFRRPDIPVGIGTGFGPLDCYPSDVLALTDDAGRPRYPVPDGFVAKTAVATLRQVLADAEDRSVVIVQVGESSNLAALLDSTADEISSLSGIELARRKVRLVAVMGGAFTLDPSAAGYEGRRESNIICSVPAAQKLVREWPGEIVFSGYEIGDRIRMNPVNLKRDYRGKSRILYDSFAFWTARCTTEGFDHRRPTWDLTPVLFVVRPEEGRGYFTLSEPGDVEIDDDGVTRFVPNPEGKRRCFLQTEEERIRAGEALADLCSEP